MIKQTIPKGMVESPLSVGNLDSLKIAHKTIIVGWVWRNRHANPVVAVIIAEEDFEKAKIVADYYERIRSEKTIKKQENQRRNPPQYVIELYKSRLAKLPQKVGGNARHKQHLKINRMLREWPGLESIVYG